MRESIFDEFSKVNNLSFLFLLYRGEKETKRGTFLEVKGISRLASLDQGTPSLDPASLWKGLSETLNKPYPRVMTLLLSFSCADVGSGHCPPPPSWDRFTFQLQKRRNCQRGASPPRAFRPLRRSIQGSALKTRDLLKKVWSKTFKKTKFSLIYINPFSKSFLEGARGNPFYQKGSPA